MTIRSSGRGGRGRSRWPGAAAWALCAALVLAAASAPHAATLPSVKQILDRIDDLYQGTGSRGVMTMKVVTQHWTREMKLAFWSKDSKQYLFRVLEPKKSKGTATLRSGDNIWNYLPKVRRTIKVPSSMMGSSWMGSHFTNNDLVKISRMADDYASKITFSGRRGGDEVIEITSLPKQDAAVVWGKLVITVRRADRLPVKIVYHKENMQPGRTMHFSDVKQLGGRRLPATMKVVPSDKPQESTLVRYDEVEFDARLDDSLFSLRSLSR